MTKLCANVPGHEGRETRATFEIEMVKEDSDDEEPNVMVTEQEFEYEEPFPVDALDSLDKVLASLLEMGFAIEDINQAIRPYMAVEEVGQPCCAGDYCFQVHHSLIALGKDFFSSGGFMHLMDKILTAGQADSPTTDRQRVRKYYAH
jgi:hypothetical protein